MNDSTAKGASVALPFEPIAEIRPPLILQREELVEIRVSYIRSQGLEWTVLQRWERDPDDGWKPTATVGLQLDEWKAVLADFAPNNAPPSTCGQHTIGTCPTGDPGRNPCGRNHADARQERHDTTVVIAPTRRDSAAHNSTTDLCQPTCHSRKMHPGIAAPSVYP